MRKATKTIFIILVVSLSVLFSVGASPNAWGWLSQESLSLTSETQQEPLTAPSSTQSKVLTSSENTSDEFVLMSKADLASAIASFEAGQEDAKKSKMTVEETEKMALATSAATSAYNQLMRTKFVVKGLCGWSFDKGIDFGLGLGLIVRDTILLEVEATKVNGFEEWKTPSDYTVRASFGFVF